MATATSSNPIPDLMYDWLTILQSKAEGINAYEKYMRDAERENAGECLDLLRQLHEEDCRQAERVRDHLKMMCQKQ